MKIIKNGNYVTIVTKNGEILSKDFSKNLEDLDLVMKSQDEDEIVLLFRPKMKEFEEKIKQEDAFLERIKKSTIVKLEGNVLTIPSISKMSCPKDLIEKILDLEEKVDDELLSSYLKFWKLCTLNPSEITRQNLFWFLNKNGFTITKSGLFVAYRNVILKNKDLLDLEFTKAITDNYLKVKRWKKAPSKYNLWLDLTDNSYRIELKDIDLNYEDENPCKANHIIDDEDDDMWDNDYDSVENYEEDIFELKGCLEDLYNRLKDHNETNEVVFTDSYSKSTTIKIGEPVKLDRRLCDDNNEVTCSKGLHVSSKDWLQQNYFGDIGLICLVNPKNVVAVPYKDDYGKMRCCEYLPIALSERDKETGELIDMIENGFEDCYNVCYDGSEGKDSNFIFVFTNKDIQFKKVEIKDLISQFKDFKTKEI